MFINWIALSISVVYQYTNDVVYRNIAYLIIIFSLIIGELIIYKWRNKRDKIINKIENSN
jgi:hypothetical protein